MLEICFLIRRSYAEIVKTEVPETIIILDSGESDKSSDELNKKPSAIKSHASDHQITVNLEKVNTQQNTFYIITRNTCLQQPLAFISNNMYFICNNMCF